jgi:hypothetical protein
LKVVFKRLRKTPKRCGLNRSVLPSTLNGRVVEGDAPCATSCRPGVGAQRPHADNPLRQRRVEREAQVALREPPRSVCRLPSARQRASRRVRSYERGMNATQVHCRQSRVDVRRLARS